MTSTVAWADVEVGTVLPPFAAPVQRMTLVQYAGASGDFNPIHWNEQFATQVGLPDVIAHGMLTMAIAGRVVTDWCGDPSALVDYWVRFTSPVVVPNDWAGVSVEVLGRVTEKREDNLVVVGITARCGDVDVLANAGAVVRLA
jgi:acyl dehydratase